MPSKILSFWPILGGFAAQYRPNKRILGGGGAAPAPPPQRLEIDAALCSMPIGVKRNLHSTICNSTEHDRSYHDAGNGNRCSARYTHGRQHRSLWLCRA